MGIRENLLAVHRRIERARRNAPDPKAPIFLVGVTKGVTVDRIQEAIRGGLRDLGENRVQEARGKIPQIGGGIRWHMVGHLQTNKAKEATRLFRLIQSVDTFRLAECLEREASRLGKEMPVLLQVNLQEKAEPFGVPPDSAPSLAKEITALAHLKLSGLMTMAPLSEDPEGSRPYFRRLRQLKETLERELHPRKMRYLSMGMSQDFEVAIEEGANLVRVGRAIFGERQR